MFVYIWKHEGRPFYVGMTKQLSRTNPRNNGGRGWLCKRTLETIGRENVVVEIHTLDTVEEAQALERKFIAEYGRVQLGTGPLTNLKSGGDGWQGMSEHGKNSLRKRMLENNPVRKPEVRAKIAARMNDPDVKARFTGENNPAKTPEARAKLKALWEDPAYREARRQEKLGKKKHSAEHKQQLREKLLDPTNPMREYHKTLNSDPTIRVRRTAALQSPEVRAKISATLKARWAERKASM